VEAQEGESGLNVLIVCNINHIHILFRKIRKLISNKWIISRLKSIVKYENKKDENSFSITLYF
jgi:hypothetical protein